MKIHVVTRAGGRCFRDSSANPVSAVGDDRREFVDQKMVVVMCVSGLYISFMNSQILTRNLFKYDTMII